MEIALGLMTLALLFAIGGLLWFAFTGSNGTAQEQLALIDAARDARTELSKGFAELGGSLRQSLLDIGGHQKERLETINGSLVALTAKQEAESEALKTSVESRLDAIRKDNESRLEKMRETVDEKLQTTLESRLGESFKRVVEQLERVHKGIGEMQALATGVGDLKKILSNVRTRGTFGEIQAGALMEQFLAPEQFVRNAQIKRDSQERVEFAVRLPGRDVGGELLLPIDAKFPKEDYERLLAAHDAGDIEAVTEAGRALEVRIRNSAKTIKDKYLDPPRTTDFAILFLPTESFYCEVLRRPGLFEQIQRDFHVTLTGPTTFSAFLNALQMGFRSLAIEKRSSEVWRLLGGIKTEFGKHQAVVEKLRRQLLTAATSVEELGTRSNIMTKKLKGVETLSEIEAEVLLGSTPKLVLEAEEDE